MRIGFGKYKGMDMAALPTSYLEWIVINLETDNPVYNEAKKILSSSIIDDEKRSKSLEEQANEILGEKPVDLLRRGNRRSKYRRR